MITDPQLAQLAAAIFTWSRTVFGLAASDVYVWRTGKRLAVAITGDPLRLELAMNRSYRNHSGWFDTSIATALGIPTRNVRGEGGPVPQFFDQDDIVFVQVVEGVESTLRDAVDADATITNVDFTVIPSPGEPYAGAPTEYFSVRRGKLTSKTPPWVVTVEVHDPNTSRDVQRPGANFCQLAPMPKTPRSIYEAIALDPQHTMIVTHTVDIAERQALASAKAVKACGGMLFPSLAVGTYPASNFGPLTLVADPAIVLAGLKPYRARGAWPVTVYSTDVWTPNTREIIGQASAEMYDQLTGNWNITVYTRPHLWMLGPQVQEDGPMGGRVISTVSSLRAAIRKRVKEWAHIRTLADLEEIKARLGGVSEAWYAYLEAKSHTILPMEWYPAAFIPAAFKTQAQKWLTAAGFTGKLHALKTNDAIANVYKAERQNRDDDDLVRLTWAKQIGEAARTMLPAKIVGTSAVDHWWP